MKFSLIVPTINRFQELERLFQSFVTQDHHTIEVIVVDQNPDDRLVKLIDRYRHIFPISHIRELKRGQSHARNIGFGYVRGDIVAFPDDDCLYPRGLLNKIAQFFDENPHMDGLLTRVYDLKEDINAFEPCGDDRSMELDYLKAYKISVSCAVFFRAHIAEKILFNEMLGPGAGTRWGCGDETDYLFRCLDAGYRFYYDSALIVRHPNPLKTNLFLQQARREFRYGLGKGHFLATHYLPGPVLKFEYRVSYRDTISAFFTGRWRRAAYSLLKAIGTSIGYKAGVRNGKGIKNTRLHQMNGNI